MLLFCLGFFSIAFVRQRKQYLTRMEGVCMYVRMYVCMYMDVCPWICSRTAHPIDVTPDLVVLLRARGSTVSSVTLFGWAVPENAASSSNSWGAQAWPVEHQEQCQYKYHEVHIAALSLSLFQSLTSMTVASHVRPTHPQRAFPHSKPCYSICRSALSSPSCERGNKCESATTSALTVPCFDMARDFLTQTQPQQTYLIYIMTYLQIMLFYDVERRGPRSLAHVQNHCGLIGTPGGLCLMIYSLFTRHILA